MSGTDTDHQNRQKKKKINSSRSHGGHVSGEVGSIGLWDVPCSDHMDTHIKELQVIHHNIKPTTISISPGTTRKKKEI